MGSREIKGESVISRKGKVIAMKQNKLFKKLWVFMLVLSFLATQFATVQAAAKTNKETISLNKSVYTLKKGKTVKGTSVKARCKITVGTPVSKVTLNRKSLTLKTGQSFSLKTSISPKKASVKKVNYKSSNKRVASVSKKGVIQADSFRIERETPYSDDYNTVAYGEAKDEADSNARPPLKNPLESVAAYDKIVLCYPIWWHTAPMTVGTFLETYDLTGKTIYPISQSASMDVSQYNQSVEFIKECAKGAVVDDGLFTKDNAVIQSYVAETVLSVKQPAEQNPSSVSHIVSYADVPLLSLNNILQGTHMGTSGAYLTFA